ncbi:MAG: DUF4235 domain-containing protein [Dermatophilaceae bacterium]
MGKKDVQKTSAEPADEEKYTVAGGLVWKVLSAGAIIAASKAANTVTAKGWSAFTGRSVPLKSNWDKANVKDVVAYSAISAALLTGAKVATERKLAEYYRQSAGHLPKAIADPKLTKAEKKAEKAAKKQLKKSAASVDQTVEQLRP